MIKKIIISLAVVAISLCSVAQQLNPMQVIENDPDVRTGTLEGGSTYYIRANKKDPQRANFHIVYKVGSAQEADNQNGLAHFLEHMAFNGSKNFQGSQLIDYLQSIGVKFGENLNAGTAQQMTTYMVINVPIAREGVVDSALLVLHDWAGFISLNEKDIDEERGVIREEWRQGNNANWRVMEKALPAKYGESIFAKRNVIGNEDVLKSFTYDDIKSFYHKWYRPDMQAFIIVGDFDVDVMEAKLKKTMSDIKAFDVKTPKEVVVLAEDETPNIAVVTDKELSNNRIELSIRTKGIPQKYNNTYIASKINTIDYLYNSMMGERISDITLKGDAPFMQAYVQSGEFGDMFGYPIDGYSAITAIAIAKDGEAIKATEAILTELYRAQRGGFTEAELDRAKAKMIAREENLYKNRNDRKNDAFVDEIEWSFLFNTPFADAQTRYDLYTQLIESTSLEEINATVATSMGDKNWSLVLSLTDKEGNTAPTEEQLLASIEKIKKSEIEIKKDDAVVKPLISKQINGSKIEKIEKGAFETTVWTLKNGVKVVLKKTDFKADEIIMRASQKGGNSIIKDIKVLNVADIYPQFMGTAGVSEFSQAELNKMLAGKNARVNLNAGSFSNNISGNCVPKDLETMMQLLYLRYTAPRFDETALNNLITQYKNLIPNIVKNPDFIIQDSVSQTRFGHNPREPKLSMEMIDMMTLENFKKVHDLLYSDANGMVFTFVGNFDEATLKPLVETYIGALPTGKAGKTGPYDVPPVKGKVDNTFKTKMETPKVTSYTIYTGKYSGTVKDNVTASAIEHILNVRYTKSVREEAGGTYGVGLRLMTYSLPKPNYALLIMFNTDISKIKELQPIIYKEVNDIMANGPAKEDLIKAKEFFVKKFAETNNTNGAWSGYIIDKALWGEDVYTNYLKDVESLTVESVQKLAKELFSQGNICTVIQEPAE